jgi:CelD/BcsL family acetyltransferase involved in cellulose biosynthesis
MTVLTRSCSSTLLKTTLTRVSTEPEFLLLENKWNRLVMESVRPVPFLTWEWVSTWWEFFGKNSTLFVLVVRDQDDRVVGIAPLHIVVRKALGFVPVRTVQFIGYRGSKVCTDHLDFLVRRQDQELITSQLISEIFARRDEWDVLELADMAEESLVPKLLASNVSDSDLVVQTWPAQHCPYVNLPDHWETLLGSMKANYRNNIRRRRNKLSNEFRVHFDCDSSPGRVAPHLELLGKLHRSARSRKGETGNFHVAQYRDFHRAVAQRMARSGKLYFARLDCDDVAVAALYGYFLGGRLFGYQTGFAANWANRGVGAVLQAMVFEDAIERLHATEYDFLRGTEPYKYTWTDRVRVTNTIPYWKNSWSARLAGIGFAAKARISSLRSQLRAPLETPAPVHNGDKDSRDV